MGPVASLRCALITRSSGRERNRAAFRNSKRSNNSSATASPPVARSGIRTPHNHIARLSSEFTFCSRGLRRPSVIPMARGSVRVARTLARIEKSSAVTERGPSGGGREAKKLNKIFGRSVPQGIYQFSDRVDDPATDSEQDHPYQIVDLLSEIGNSQLHRLRSPEEDGSQEQDDRYRSHKNRDQLVHKGCSSTRITPQLLAKLVALDLAGRRARQIAGHFEPPWPLVGRQRLRQPFARGRHRSRAVGAGRRNDIEHDFREPDFAFTQHGCSFADRADAGQHILDLGRRDPDAGHLQHITGAAAVMIEAVRACRYSSPVANQPSGRKRSSG